MRDQINPFATSGSQVLRRRDAPPLDADGSRNQLGTVHARLRSGGRDVWLCWQGQALLESYRLGRPRLGSGSRCHHLQQPIGTLNRLRRVRNTPYRSTTLPVRRKRFTRAALTASPIAWEWVNRILSITPKDPLVSGWQPCNRCSFLPLLVSPKLNCNKVSPNLAAVQVMPIDLKPVPNRILRQE